MNDTVVSRGRLAPGAVFLAAWVLSCPSVLGVPGATVPWTTYEAEAMTYSGIVLGPSYAPNVVASESSGRQCVQISAVGGYVQFTAQASANALVVRYSVPDTVNGGGQDYTLSLYKNGAYIGKLPVTSKYSWLYGALPFSNTPGSSPRNFYDEARTNGLSIAAGDVIKLQKDSTDTASYYIIDLVDLENVAAPLTQPANSLSVKSYGAVGDGNNNDTTAFKNCISAASSQGKSVWMPAGTYKITEVLSVPGNLAIRGAGMWHTTLVGDPAYYPYQLNRVAFNGNGSNIQLSDFAIIGKLAYRNDSEQNDGLGGSYGTGSTISRVWVEHTKAGAWLVNSLGLVVDGCRFRNTIADGINVCVGMRSTIVTNCTARGTGDDSFAIWPATYLIANYTPGLNVIRNCTAQTPFLANGGAIYGGEANKIEDCLFRDITYGCGVLLSTTFGVSHTFSGTTVVQRSDLLRCGGYDPGFQWRAALQICLQNSGINGLDLNNLNITNSISDGLSVIYGAGALANATMSSVSIPNYGIGAGSRNGLWARSDANGSMTVSNCSIVQWRDDAANFTFNFVTTTIPVTVQASPSGRSFTVDGVTYTTAQLFNWTSGSSHTLGASSPQSGGAGTQYVWSSWSDGGAVSHTVAPTASTTYTVNFGTQYYLTMNAGTGGTVSPSSSWQASGASVNINATPNSGYSFVNWAGSGSGSYSGTSSGSSVVMNGPITETAAFTNFTKVISLGGNLDFGNVAVGSSSNRTLTISNAGTATLTVSGISYPTGFTGAWSGAIPAGGSTNVTVTFSPVVATAYGTSLTASSDATSGGSTLGISGVGAYPVYTLTYPQQPVDVLQGAALTPAVRVQAFGSLGQTLPGVPINISLGSGSGSVAGTLSRVTDAGGVATFNDLSFNQPGPKTLSASATFGPVSPLSSVGFMVIGPATALAFTTQPAGAVPGVPFTQQPVLKTVDAYGSPSTVGLPATLTVAVGLTNGPGTLSGTTNYNIGAGGSNGVVAFSNLAVSSVGTGYRLVASAPGVVSNTVSGMSIWLDGSEASSVLTNASGVVTSWQDLSGHGNHFATTIGSGGGGIRYTNTAANGLKTVTFNATSATTATELKNSSYINGSKTISVFVVVRKTVAGTAEGGWQRVLGSWAGGPLFDWQDVGSFEMDYADNNNIPRLTRNSLAVRMEGPVMDPSTNWHVFQYVADGLGSNSFWLTTVGGTTQATGPTPGNLSSNFNIVATSVGGGLQSETTINNPLAGSIAEVLVYSLALSDAQRLAVQTYLTNKWFGSQVGLLLSPALSGSFDVLPAGISVTVQPFPAGRSFTVDGVPYTSAQVFSWTPGATHTVATTSPQSGAAGTQYVWSGWSDAGAMSHTVAPTVDTTYTASFTTQYYLTMNAGDGGSVSPDSGWQNGGTSVGISATASNGYTFLSWVGSGDGSYSNGQSTASVYMNGPITQTATFAPIPTRVLVLSGELAFGEVEVGSSSNRTMTISNTGNSTLTVSGISYPAGFGGTWSGAIPAGGLTNVTVTFLPAQETNYTGNLTVISDATAGGNTLGLSGAGVVVVQNPNRMESPVVSGSGEVVVTYHGSPNSPYALESAASLELPVVWTAVSTNSTGTNGIVNFTNPVSVPAEFYRTRRVNP